MTKRSYLHAGCKPKVSRKQKIINRVYAHAWAIRLEAVTMMFTMKIREKLEGRLAQAQMESQGNQSGE